MGVVGRVAGFAKGFFDPATVGAITFSLVLAVGLMLFVRPKTYIHYMVNSATDSALPYLYAISRYQVDSKTLYSCLAEAVNKSSEEVCGLNLTEFLTEKFGEPFVLYNSTGGVILKTMECKGVRAAIPVPRGGTLVVCYG